MGRNLNLPNLNVVGLFKSGSLESGTWTPTLSIGGTAASGPYTTQSGVWRRIADMVYIEAEIELDGTAGALGAGSGLATISLPSSLPPAIYNAFVGCAEFDAATALNGLIIGVTVAGSGDEVALRQAQASDGTTAKPVNVTEAELNDNTRIVLTGWYRTA